MSSNNVVMFNGVTRLDLPADRILDQAKGQCASVLVIGWANDGSTYFASSLADGGDVLWLLEGCKKQLLEVGYGEK